MLIGEGSVLELERGVYWSWRGECIGVGEGNIEEGDNDCIYTVVYAYM
jgi:hypothetical protein